MFRRSTLVFLLIVAACSSGGDSGGGADTDAKPPLASADPDALAPGLPTDAGGDAPPSPSGLPFPYERPDVGTPLTPAELAAATDELIALLSDTRYFDFVDERVHGWPASAGGFWYGTWWSGVSIVKAGGKITYDHLSRGADNNGLRTGPYLEGACYAHLLAGKPVAARLVRKMARGYTSWGLAIKRSAGDTAGAMLARASYPSNVTSTDDGRTIAIDYSKNRPGEDNGATAYVHLPNNPTFGDVFIKNKRSKDDMGHIFRSLAQTDAACAARLDAAGKADLAQARDTMAAWSKQVEADGWGIATLDKSANVWMPPTTETLAHYFPDIGNLECPGALMMRLLGHGDPGSLSCDSGISVLEGFATGKSNKQILRTHHEAAAVVALLVGQNPVALKLLQGLAERLDSEVPVASQPSPPPETNPTDVASMVLQSANAGVPLTSAEVRWIHQRLHTAYTAYRAPSLAATFRVFDPATPDGTYAYDVTSDGLAFSDLGVLLGSCASRWRNPAGRPLLDCARLVAALRAS